MFVVMWRYNANSEWFASKPFPTEQDARGEIVAMTRYDVSGRRQYRIASIGAPDTWHDPYAEQAEQAEQEGK